MIGILVHHIWRGSSKELLAFRDAELNLSHLTHNINLSVSEEDWHAIPEQEFYLQDSLKPFSLTDVSRFQLKVLLRCTLLLHLIGPPTVLLLPSELLLWSRAEIQSSVYTRPNFLGPELLGLWSQVENCSKELTTGDEVGLTAYQTWVWI